MNVRKFRVDKANGKIAGVCAGLGETTGVDPNVIRIGFVLAGIFGSIIAAMIVYGVLAMAGSPRNARSRERALARADRKFRGAPAMDERLRAHERRMKEIDTFVAGSNSRLAREIEELRN
ncbi:MAG TPA: PspC domain-containing protein [Allosphingosinicella sp.]|nr:PspC domain-containing protein [Allosphingosinicella sp.]